MNWRYWLLLSLSFYFYEKNGLAGTQQRGHTYAYKNLLATGKPWPAEKLGELVSSYPRARYFRVSWGFFGPRFNDRVAVFYDRHRHEMRYDDFYADWKESGQPYPYRGRTLIFHNVTPAALSQLRIYSKKQEQGAEDAHFFHLLQLGAYLTSAHSSKRLTLAKIQDN